MPLPDLAAFTDCWLCEGTGHEICHTCGTEGRGPCPDCGQDRRPCSECHGRGTVRTLDQRLPRLLEVVDAAFERLRRQDGFDCSLLGHHTGPPSRLRPFALVDDEQIWYGALDHDVHDGPLEIQVWVFEPLLPIGAADVVARRLVEAGAALLDPSRIGLLGPPVADHPWLVRREEYELSLVMR